MKQGLILANEMGLHSIQIESDLVEVINACSGQDRIWNEASAIYADCFILAGMIGLVQFSHCFREANVGAHSLAKNAFHKNVACKWEDDPPDFLIECLVNDVTILPMQ